jgi:hypothetical protein
MKNWDVFISHASEDKEDVAVPLAKVLQRAGLRVWIDKQEIELGDSIRQRIDDGLARSRFGVVVLSQAFLRKVWTQRELAALLSIEEAAGQKVLLPVWHRIAKADVAVMSPLLADRAAADTTPGIHAVAGKIMDVVLRRTSNSPSTLFPSVTRRLAELIEAGDQGSLVDFLLNQPQIVRRAVGEHEGDVTLLPQSDPPVLMTLTFGGSTHDFYASYVAFASSRAFPLRGDIAATKVVETCLQIIEENLSAHIHYYSKTRMVLCGRRGSISDADRKWLRARMSLLGIQIRSYDWLLEASLNS